MCARGRSRKYRSRVDDVDPQRHPGRNLITRSSCPSTQDLIRDEANLGAPAGSVAVTDHQTAGRGRRGRSWLDAPGKALMFSYLARPRRALAELGPLSLVAGLVVCEAVGGLARLRWPNDVVFGERKVAGVLVELVTPTDGPAFAVIGIGINANFSPSELPETDRLAATSLLIESGSEVDRVALLETVALRLDVALKEFDAHGFAGFLPRYAAVDALAGSALTLRLADAVVTGQAAGVDAAGRLRLRSPDGTEESYAAGEVERVLDPLSAHQSSGNATPS